MAAVPDADAFIEKLAAARSGSTEALGWLFAYLRPYLLTIANDELGNELHAKGSGADLVQETLLQAQLLLSRFTGQGEAEFRAWLRAVLLNKLADFRRKYHFTRRRSVHRELSIDGPRNEASLHQMLADDGSTPSHTASRSERAVLVLRAIERLPEQYRRIIQWRNWDGQTFQDIGKQLGKTEDAVRMLWGRALQRLQEELEPLQ